MSLLSVVAVRIVLVAACAYALLRVGELYQDYALSRRSRRQGSL